MLKQEITEGLTDGDRCTKDPKPNVLKSSEIEEEFDWDTSADYELFKTPGSQLQKRHGRSEKIVNITNIIDNHFPFPEKFNFGENFAQFCEKFKRYVVLNNLDNTPNLHLRFLSLLDTKTDIMFSSVILTEPQQSNVDEICKIFLQNYDPILDQAEIMKRLLQIKQKPKQSITDFAYQLQSYFRQFASSFDNEAEKSNIMEKYLINAFCEGLRNIEIRRHLLAIKTERTFQNILNYAKKYEYIGNCDNFLKNNDKSTEINVDYIVKCRDRNKYPHRSSEFQPFHDKEERRERFSSRRDNPWIIASSRRSFRHRAARKNKVCFNCKSPFHLVKYCKYSLKSYENDNRFTNHCKIKQNTVSKMRPQFQLHLKNRFNLLDQNFRLRGILNT